MLRPGRRLRGASPLPWQASSFPHGPHAELCIVGFASRIYEHQAAAQALHDETHLLPWAEGGAQAGETPPRIDRFDGRHLLSWRELQAEPGLAAEDAGNMEAKDTAEVDAERYRYLPAEAGGNGVDADEEDLAQKAAQDVEAPKKRGKFSAVPFDYGGDKGGAGDKGAVVAPGQSLDAGTEDNGDGVRDKNDTAAAPDDIAEAFHVTFAIPEGLALPSSMKHHGIIAATADRLRKRPHNAALVLLKERGNTWYDFLREGNALHGYYRYLLEEAPHVSATDRVSDAAPPPSALSLLGADYDSESDASDDEHMDGVPPAAQAALAKEADVASLLDNGSLDEPTPPQSDADRIKKLQRLARARALRSRFLGQAAAQGEATAKEAAVHLEEGAASVAPSDSNAATALQAANAQSPLQCGEKTDASHSADVDGLQGPHEKACAGAASKTPPCKRRRQSRFDRLTPLRPLGKRRADHSEKDPHDEQ